MSQHQSQCSLTAVKGSNTSMDQGTKSGGDQFDAEHEEGAKRCPFIPSSRTLEQFETSMTTMRGSDTSVEQGTASSSISLLCADQDGRSLKRSNSSASVLTLTQRSDGEDKRFEKKPKKKTKRSSSFGF